MVNTKESNGVVVDAEAYSSEDEQCDEGHTLDNDDAAETRLMPSQRFVVHSFSVSEIRIYDRELCYHLGRVYEGAEGWHSAILDIERLEKQEKYHEQPKSE